MRFSAASISELYCFFVMRLSLFKNDLINLATDFFCPFVSKLKYVSISRFAICAYIVLNGL